MEECERWCRPSEVCGRVGEWVWFGKARVEAIDAGCPKARLADPVNEERDGLDGARRGRVAVKPLEVGLFWFKLLVLGILRAERVGLLSRESVSEALTITQFSLIDLPKPVPSYP